MKLTLPNIVISQLLCTSLWFAGNSIITDITRELSLDDSYLAHLTSAIQFGFIVGTLVFAIFTIADRYSPSLVFFWSALIASVLNLGITIGQLSAGEILLFRFFTGFFLAGIYPVGMKIVSDYFPSGLGKSLGFLVGALVVGTASPHLFKYIITDFPWQYVLYVTSSLAIIGGLIILIFVPDGPYRKASTKINLKAYHKVFQDRRFRSVAFGYFGHMWELYTFWAFVPIMLITYNAYYPETLLDVSMYSFLIIASGGLACVFSGAISHHFGALKVASSALSISCICCMLSPFFLFINSTVLFVVFLFIWGLSVIADSPLFSSLVAQMAPDESRGTSLTIVNCIGFSITILSIQCTSFLATIINFQYIYMILAIGPLLGLLSLYKGHVKSK